MKGKKIFENKNHPVLPKTITLKATDEILKGTYSNVAYVHHTKNEFIIDFVSQFATEPQIVSRIILSPIHMKSLIDALKENYARFDKINNPPKKNSVG